MKALTGLEHLRSALRMVPDSISSNPQALNAWLASIDSGSGGPGAIIETLEREVCLPGLESCITSVCMLRGSVSPECYGPVNCVSGCRADFQPDVLSMFHWLY